MKKFNLYGFSVAVVKHERIEKVFKVRETTIIAGQWKVKRKVTIVSSTSFRVEGGSRVWSRFNGPLLSK